MFYFWCPSTWSQKFTHSQKKRTAENRKSVSCSRSYSMLKLQTSKMTEWLDIIIWAASPTKPTKWPVRPAKTQISLGIRPDWSESSLSAWKTVGSLATQWAHSEDSDPPNQSLPWAHRSFCWFCREAAHSLLQSWVQDFGYSNCLVISNLISKSPWKWNISAKTLDSSKPNEFPLDRALLLTLQSNKKMNSYGWWKCWFKWLLRCSAIGSVIWYLKWRDIVSLRFIWYIHSIH